MSRISNIMQVFIVALVLSAVTGEFYSDCSGYGTSMESGIVDDSGCLADSATDIICAGRGSCICGQCECFQRENPVERIFGQYCECDNFNCPHRNNLPCSGHGRCGCGECSCEPDWTGEACQCSVSLETCIPELAIIMHLNHSGICDLLRSCVQCRVHHTGEFKDMETCENNCEKVPEPEIINEVKDEKRCAFTDPTDQCKFYFMYDYDDMGEVGIHAQRLKDCPPEPPIFWTVSTADKTGISEIWKIILSFLSILKVLN